MACRAVLSLPASNRQVEGTEDSTRTVLPEKLQFSLAWTKCCSQGQAPIHMHFQQTGLALACSHLLFDVYALPNATAPLLESGLIHCFLLHPMHFKKATQQSPQWISVIFMILLLSARVVSSYRPGGKLCTINSLLQLMKNNLLFICRK